MPYAIMRFKKTGTGGIAPAQKHNEREKTKYKSNPDIDAKRIKDDYHIIKPDKPYRAIIKDKLSSSNCRIRKDSVLMVETILTASPEFMNELPPEEQKKFFRLATQFFEKEIGKENIISAIVHMDEKNASHAPVLCATDSRWSSVCKENHRRQTEALPLAGFIPQLHGKGVS